MKITFIATHLLSGGSERTISYLSSYFAESGDEVSIICISDDVFYKLNPKVRLICLGISLSPSGAVQRIICAAKRFVYINRALKKESPDVVFCMLPDVAKYILRAHKKRRFKLISSERNNPATVKNESERETKINIFSQCDGIVFQTRRAMEYYPKSINLKGIVIQNAMGNELVYQIPEIKERKEKITAIGRLTEQKDYPTLIAAFKKIIASHPGFTLEIFGSGSESYKKRLVEIADSAGLSEKISFKGSCPDAILQAADSACYVMSSLFEGMPNALIEAMAAGIPCVSTDCPNGPAELIDDGENGLLVPVGDAEAMAAAVIRMIEDKPLAEKCSGNARKILKTHSVEAKAGEYRKYIESVLNG